MVEDETPIREFIAELLGESGYEVATAANGRDALECLRATVPDAVLLDLMMPVMDGWAFLRECRASRPFAHLPVVVMSAAQAGARSLDGLNVHSFVRKPFDLEQVEGALARALQGA